MLMGFSFEYFLVGVAILLILSVTASKLSDRFGIPALLLFLIIGMLAGSDGPGGIYFDNAPLAQYIGVAALVIILFSGGLDTNFESIRLVYKTSLPLATVGVLLTALVTGAFTHWTLGISWLESILLGSIVSSTDAAAVFSILRSKGVNLKGVLRPLLELESGSNDPMAIFLTVGLVQLAVNPERTVASLVPMFFMQMIIGAVAGILTGKITIYLINRMKLGYEGLYPVLVMGAIFLTYGLTTLAQGSGFLAVYIAGLMMSREEFLHKRGLLRFYDGMAWLMQITMFLTLGLLVFPSHLTSILLPGLAISLALIFIARPLSVMLTLVFNRLPLREKGFISWVGLRGAVPVILATYPRLAGLEKSELIFNVVFFVVLTSVLFQGTTIPYVARWLGVDTRKPFKRGYPIEYIPEEGWPGTLKEIQITEKSWAAGKAIFELSLPPEYLVVLIARGNEFIVPNGSIVLQPGDTLLGLGEVDCQEQVEAKLQAPKKVL